MSLETSASTPEQGKSTYQNFLDAVERRRRLANPVLRLGQSILRSVTPEKARGADLEDRLGEFLKNSQGEGGQLPMVFVVAESGNSSDEVSVLPRIEVRKVVAGVGEQAPDAYQMTIGYGGDALIGFEYSGGAVEGLRLPDEQKTRNLREAVAFAFAQVNQALKTGEVTVQPLNQNNGGQ